VIRRNGILLEEAPVGSQTINVLAGRLLASIVGRRTFAERALSSALYDIVIRPIIPHLGSQDTLVFIPDQGLHRIPFAALFDKDRGRYLLEDHVIIVAPSSTLAVEAVGQGRDLRANPTVLAVGNPTFRKDIGQELPDLPHAEREAEEIAKLLPGSEILIRESATKNRFLGAIDRHEVIHFGGHAIVNQEFPLLSSLVLSPEGSQDSGVLYAHELYLFHFRESFLVVLAACDTASGPIQGEGVGSLARSFSAAGIPNVIASLWNVRDDETAKLWGFFYGRLRMGENPAAALRHAQINLLSKSDWRLRPDIWAAFEYLGSPARL
jgi:CHAT domain-containing protein